MNISLIGKRLSLSGNELSSIVKIKPSRWGDPFPAGKNITPRRKNISSRGKNILPRGNQLSSRGNSGHQRKMYFSLLDKKLSLIGNVFSPPGKIFPFSRQKMKPRRGFLRIRYLNEFINKGVITWNLKEERCWRRLGGG